MNDIKNKKQVIMAIKQIIKRYSQDYVDEMTNEKIRFQQYEAVVIFEIKKQIIDNIRENFYENNVEKDTMFEDGQLIDMDKIINLIWEILIYLENKIVSIMENPERYINIQIYMCQKKAIAEIKELFNEFST